VHPKHAALETLHKVSGSRPAEGPAGPTTASNNTVDILGIGHDLLDDFALLHESIPFSLGLAHDSAHFGDKAFADSFATVAFHRVVARATRLFLAFVRRQGG
jgi:hypothetical protein